MCRRGDTPDLQSGRFLHFRWKWRYFRMVPSMGPIRKGEAITDAAKRVALEQVGAKIEPVGVPLCERVLLSLGNMTILRWYLVVVAEMSAGELRPQDKREGREPHPFDLPPTVNDAKEMNWMVEMHRIGMRYLRSLDALDGI